MKKGWETRRLGEVTKKIGSGATPQGGEANYKQSGISLIRSLNVHDCEFRLKDLAFIDETQARQLDNVSVEPGDVLLNITGASVARCCIVPNDLLPARVNQHVSILRPIAHQLSPHFLQYLLVSGDYKNRLLNAGDGGATRQALTKAQLQDFEIELPPLPEQRRIVGILDEAFAGLATAEANAARNLQNAREIFDSHLHAVFSQRREGWVERRLDEVTADDCSLSYGIVQPGDEVAGGIPLIRPTDMVDGEITLCGLKRIDPRAADGYGRTKIQGGELLVCVRGTTGLVSIASTEVAGGNVTRGIVPVRFRGSWISHDFGFFMLRSDAVQRQIRQKTYGAALQQINISDLRKIMISFPSSDKTQAELAGLLQATREDSGKLLNIYTQKQRKLAELKKSLLSAAFNGDL